MDEQRPNLRPQHRLIYEAFRERGAPATDAEMSAALGIPGSSYRPRRRELADMGFLEKAGSEAGTGGRSIARWRAVPLERVAEVREANSGRKPRRRSPQDFPLEQRIEMVRILLGDDEVNRALLGMQGRSWSRARGRARNTRVEKERELQAKIKEAERNRDLTVHFLKAKRNLLRALEVMRGVEGFVDDDLERRQRNEPVRIAKEHWPEVADLLADVASSATAAEELIRERFGLTDDVIDLEGFEVEEIFELTEGEGASFATKPRSQGPDD
jgi:hypothetical protein